MLTGRGGGFLMLVFAAWAFALNTGIVALSIAGTLLLIWFFLAWLLFVLRVRLARGRLRLVRTLFDEHGPVRQLWARSPYRVVVEIHNEGRLALPFVVAIDRAPLLAARTEGEHHVSGRLARGEPLGILYTLEASAGGNLRFEGVKLLVSDLEGFFAAPLFVRSIEVVRVLPPLADARGHVPAVKRLNILPLLGPHPHRRAGSGIELLELRDYQAGDPPKLIAWKISARRDRLMTRELESEVPIRCTLFVDTSDSVRLGAAGQTALARLTEIAGAVAQANAAARDLTGLCLFDEQSVVRLVRPARGRRPLLELIHLLSEHADLLPRTNRISLPSLLPLAYGLAQDLYPELLRRDLNAFPWWLPAWSPRPLYTARLPGPRPCSRLGRFLHWLERRLRDGPLGWVATLPRRFRPKAFREYRQRKQLAALLAALYRLGPEATAHLLEDDDACRDAALRFLRDHQQPFPLRLYDEEGRYAFAAAGKVDVLARALLSSIRRGQDNELFVLLVDLLETEELEPLLRAIRVARARRHEVMLICAWPPDVPPPAKARDRSPRPVQDLLEGPIDVEQIVRRATVWRLQQAYDRLERTMGRAGARVVCARANEATTLVLKRMQRLRVFQRGVP
ncbi:MAG: DUF58 domain-containing protein [Gemmataceae bacterium]